MKKSSVKFLVIMNLALLASCEKIVFLPVLGDVEGTVTDNNGKPLAGVTITAGYEAPTEFGQPESRSNTFITGTDGYYRFNDLWDQVLVQINHPGFESATALLTITNRNRLLTANLSLNGSPTIRELNFDKLVLTTGDIERDSILFSIQVQDLYNRQSGTYRANLLLVGETGSTRAIIAASMAEQGFQQSLLSGWIKDENLSAGSYRVIAEVIDPDENSHQVTAEEMIRIE